MRIACGADGPCHVALHGFYDGYLFPTGTPFILVHALCERVEQISPGFRYATTEYDDFGRKNIHDRCKADGKLSHRCYPNFFCESVTIAICLKQLVCRSELPA